MLLDIATFAGNVFAEIYKPKDKRIHTRNQLIASGLSFATLVGLSVVFLSEGVSRLLHPSLFPEDVNHYVVFGVSILEIVIDLVSLVPFCWYKINPFTSQHQPVSKQSVQSPPTTRMATAPTAATPHPFSDNVNVNRNVIANTTTSEALHAHNIDSQASSSTRMNLCSAIMHVLSDLLRATATLLESLILWHLPSLNSETVDAIAAIAVSVLVLVPTLGALWVWVRDAREHLSSPGLVQVKHTGLTCDTSKASHLPHKESA